MLLAWTLILAVVSQEMPSNSKARVSEPLTAAEKNQLEREPNVEDRIRVYEAASSRIYGSIRNLILRQQFGDVGAKMSSWLDLLSEAQQDIEQNISRKKKSKNLIRFEIHLRKAIGDLKERKLQVPADQQEDFESWLTRLDHVRKKFVDIPFGN